jgi:lipoate-protein ligase A
MNPVEFLDLSLPSPASNLACDEALLDACEEGAGGQVLRFWEPGEYFVVAGFSNEVAREVNVDACRQAGVGIFRRCSGGGTVLQGPGCLNYSLVLSLEAHPQCQTIPAANHYIMGAHREALTALLRQPVEVRGITDLAIAGQKFSGNAQRRKRRALLFHGTFLLSFDLALVERFLTMPSRQPDYRVNRPHGRFLTNVQAPAAAVREALRSCWKAGEPARETPDWQRLAAEKYSRDEWNLKF